MILSQIEQFLKNIFNYLNEILLVFILLPILVLTILIIHGYKGWRDEQANDPKKISEKIQPDGNNGGDE